MCNNCKSDICQQEVYRLNLQCLFQKLQLQGNKLCIDGGNCIELPSGLITLNEHKQIFKDLFTGHSNI